jgi:hypothetical protein
MMRTSESPPLRGGPLLFALWFRQKIKDCAAKWSEAKKADSNLKGRKAYNDFMSKCLKG